MPLSESEMEEIRIVAIRLFSSVADGGVAPPLQVGDRVTVEIEELYYKDGTFPASKAAIAALPAVTITAAAADGEGGFGECAICLTEYVAGEEVKEMPCKHRYHSGCIGKWLAIHGSCPFCRYEIIDTDKEEDEQIMVVSVYIQRSDQNDSDHGAPDDDDSGDADQNDSDNGAPDDDDDSGDSLDMEIDYNGSSMEDVD